VVPLDDAGVVRDKDLPGKDGELDETQKQINKMCGIDDETWKKYGPGAKK